MPKAAWPPTEREPGRPWTFRDYFDAHAWGHVPSIAFTGYRRTNPMFDRWCKAEATRVRKMVEGWRAEQDDGA